MLDRALRACAIRLACVSSTAARITELHNLARHDIACDMRNPRSHRGLQLVQIPRARARAVAVLQRALPPVLVGVLPPRDLDVSHPREKTVPPFSVEMNERRPFSLGGHLLIRRLKLVARDVHLLFASGVGRGCCLLADVDLTRGKTKQKRQVLIRLVQEAFNFPTDPSLDRVIGFVCGVVRIETSRGQILADDLFLRLGERLLGGGL
mmetsp:Transcript_37459/g.99458  ORF Transcript_37459/g.99458 Transcript_37459/m.99458 type:complete len:208 (+) Transcript_37459:339-962(+)